ncbi:MAG: FAD-dependent oxidoreductase [Rhodothermia bacterium]
MEFETEIVVLGAGVAGLTSAVALLEAGFEVSVRADRVAPDITSSVAAGLWYPYAVSGRRVPDLAIRTLRRYHLLHHDPATGVRLRPCRSIVPLGSGTPFWAGEDVGYAPAETGSGFQATLPVADSTLFLGWLVGRIRELGGNLQVDPKPVERISSIDAATVVNCTGLGARQLCTDNRMHPIKGTVVLVENPGIDYCLTDDADPSLPTYFIPLSVGLILGGTAEVGNWDTDVDPDQQADIISRCARHEPNLLDARIIAAKAGLRPGRDEIRLEREVSTTGQTIVHNYGHGGSGYTLAWGCAEEVVRMVGGRSGGLV